MTQQSSYAQILRSSSIMGGVAVVGLLLEMVRTKFAAVLIGTTGAGLIANFGAMQGFIGTLAGLGIQFSAVREVAAAYAKGDQQEIGRTILTLRRVCWLTGLLGMASLVLLSPWLSQLTFGSAQYQWDIAALGLIVLLGNISGGQTALLQGTRRIADMARMQMISAVVGTAVSIGLYFWLGLRGIVPALVAMAVFGLALSWYFARRVPVPAVRMSWSQSLRAASGMARLGLAMMWNGLLGSAVAYATNALITQQINLQAVGIYSAAFALSGMFVNFVLGAMGADYFPRLSGASGDKAAMNRLVNEQTEIGLLLAAPGLLATLTLAPWIIEIFYTKEFLPAVELLQWFILGCLGRVISWPLGFVMLALNKGRWFVLAETSGQLLHFILIFIGLSVFGIKGASIAFFLMYIVYSALVFGIVRHLNEFYWSLTCRKLMLIIFLMFAASFISTRLLPLWLATTIGIFVIFISSILSLRGLVTRVGVDNKIIRVAFRVPGIEMMCRFKAATHRAQGGHS